MLLKNREDVAGRADSGFQGRGIMCRYGGIAGDF